MAELAGDAAQLVECLASMHEALASISSATSKNRNKGLQDGSTDKANKPGDLHSHGRTQQVLAVVLQPLYTHMYTHIDTYI